VRVILVGTSRARARLRAVLPPSIEIVGETDTFSSARELLVGFDAWMVAPQHAAPPVDDPPVEPLTARELDVLALMAEGLPNKAIAARLEISDQTVKYHVSAICGKLGAANRTEAVRQGLRAGLISI
jgi:DNA-binding NarL/FixJ family response regulator